MRGRAALGRLSRWTAAACLVAWCAGPALAEEEGGLGALAWMAGHWAGVEGAVVSEEVWIEPKGGLMVGLHRDVGPSGPAFFEFLRIEERDSGLVFVAQPSGREPTDFPAVSVGPQRVVFENLEHDFPQRLAYSIDEEGRLVARVEGRVGDEVKSAEWRWSRVE